MLTLVVFLLGAASCVSVSAKGELMEGGLLDVVCGGGMSETNAEIIQEGSN